MSNSIITLNSAQGEPFSGYLTTTGTDKKPGIVLIQEIFGVNPSIREAADRFAQQGYTVLAPDIFWRLKSNIQLGYEGKDLEQAFDYYHRFDLTHGVQDLVQTVTTLKQHPSCNGQVAVLGFCLGGKLAYLTAAHTSVSAVVAFYGAGIADHLDLAAQITCPVLMHFGADDEMIPADQIEMIRAAFVGHNRNVTIEVYPGVGHAFYNAHRSSYHAAAAQLATERTLAFLHQALHASHAESLNSSLI